MLAFAFAKERAKLLQTANMWRNEVKVGEKMTSLPASEKETIARTIEKVSDGVEKLSSVSEEIIETKRVVSADLDVSDE